MDVQIVVFPETKVAAVEHFGSPAFEHDTLQKLIAWPLNLGTRTTTARKCIILDRHDFRTAILCSGEAAKCCSRANRRFRCGSLEFKKRANFCPISSKHAHLSDLATLADGEGPLKLRVPL